MEAVLFLCMVICGTNLIIAIGHCWIEYAVSKEKAKKGEDDDETL